jgi:MHS family proline/betaine transporter-like MFS transporter
VGGEWGSCVSFLTEYAKPQNRALIASFSQIGAAVGLLLGALAGMLLSTILSPADLIAWGWRVAFLSGILVAAFGYYVRSAVAETPVFQEKIDSQTLSKSPLKEAFRDYKKEMITVFFLVGGANVTYWLILNFMSTYITRFLKLPMTTGFSLTVVSLIAFIIALPIGGWLADRYGRRPMILLGGGGIAFLGYPLFQVLAQTSAYLEMASVVCALTVIFAMFQGGFNVGIAELFPTAIRCSGFSVPYQLACAVFGGTAMAIVTWLYGLTGNVMVVPIYMCGIMFIVFLTGLFMFKETKGKSLG